MHPPSPQKHAAKSTPPLTKLEPIWTRKLDLLYLLYFLIHIPVMFLIDLAPLYPTALKPTFLTTLRTWYITTYADRFFTHPPAWFQLYMYMEALYHVPLSVWAVGALLRDSPLIPLHLLIYAVQTALTTSTCIADFLSWSQTSTAEKWALAGLYVPYLLVSVGMGVDMFGRLRRRLLVTGRR